MKHHLRQTPVLHSKRIDVTKAVHRSRTTAQSGGRASGAVRAV